jgi:hypothetical protein
MCVCVFVHLSERGCYWRLTISSGHATPYNENVKGVISSLWLWQLCQDNHYVSKDKNMYI